MNCISQDAISFADLSPLNANPLVQCKTNHTTLRFPVAVVTENNKSPE
jgi:hypothetical protein